MQYSNSLQTEMLQTERGYSIAYQHYTPKQSSQNQPGIIFLHGHGSDMFGGKAEAIMNWAVGRDIEFTRFDLFGHGVTGGDIMTATVGQWLKDARDILDKVTSRKQIIIGSSLGGWIMLALSKYRHEKINSMVGIAAAPDFTKHLIWERLDKSEQEAFRKNGLHSAPNPYGDTDTLYPYQLICEAENHLVLEHDIRFDGAVILHHGLCDAEVPWQTAIQIAEKLSSNQVTIHFDKTATHRYSEYEQLNSLISSIRGLVTDYNS